MITFDGITLRLGGHLILDRASRAAEKSRWLGRPQRGGQVEPVEADRRNS
jgi:hypothetical protein